MTADEMPEGLTEKEEMRFGYLLGYGKVRRAQAEHEGPTQHAHEMLQDAAHAEEVIENLRAIAALRAKVAELEQQAKIADEAIVDADERINQPCGDALDKLWQEIILRRRPNYGDWEYPGQAYRHIKAEFTDIEKELAEKEEALEAAYAGLCNPEQCRILKQKDAEIGKLRGASSPLLAACDGLIKGIGLCGLDTNGPSVEEFGFMKSDAEDVRRYVAEYRAALEGKSG